MGFAGLLPLAAVVAGALLLVAATVGVGLLVKTLVTNARQRDRYLRVHNEHYSASKTVDVILETGEHFTRTLW